MPQTSIDHGRFGGWSACHAAGMAATAMLVAAGLPLWSLSAMALLSFALLLYRGRRQWTPDGRFGPANLLTFGRIAATAFLPLLAPVQVAAAALLLAAADGLDGRIARRRGLASAFGEHADQEADALLVLMLCVLLYRLPVGFGAWILLPGLLRYLFVLFALLARPPQPMPKRSLRAAVISVLVLLTLAACFVFQPLPPGLRLLAAAATLLLIYSFACSVYELWGNRGRMPPMRQDESGARRRARKSK